MEMNKVESCSELEKANDAMQKAIEADENRDYNNALKFYYMALNSYANAIKNEIKNEVEKITIRFECKKHYARARQLEGYVSGGGSKNTNTSTLLESKKTEASNAIKFESEEDDKQKRLKRLADAIITEKPNVKWETIAGLTEAKKSLRNAIILPINYPDFFTDELLPWKGILLYGPPGTGKSHLARAVATEAATATAADLKFFCVSPSDLISKWYGESEKLIRDLFELARKGKRSIIFIDEVDSFCSTRNNHEADTDRRVKNQILTEMDGFHNSANENVLVLGATNTPWSLDQAVIRRFEKRIYVPLPDETARIKLFKFRIGKKPHNLSDEDFKDLAKKTEGYSGADIGSVVKEALINQVQKFDEAQYFKQVSGPSQIDPSKTMGDLFTPCSPDEPGASKMTPRKLTEYKRLLQKLTKDDLTDALRKQTKSVSQVDLEKYERFGKN